MIYPQFRTVTEYSACRTPTYQDLAAETAEHQHTMRGGEIDSLMHPHPFPLPMREVDRRLKESTKGNEAAKSKPRATTASAGKAVSQRLSGNALLPFTGRVVALGS